jgi:hypothetical protein
MLRRLLLYLIALVIVSFGCIGTYLWLHAHGLASDQKSARPKDSRDQEQSPAETTSPSAQSGIARKPNKSVPRTEYSEQLYSHVEIIKADQSAKSLAETNEKIEALDAEISALHSQLAEKDARSQHAQELQQAQQAATESLQSQLQAQQAAVAELLRQKSDFSEPDSGGSSLPNHIKSDENSSTPVYNAIFSPTAGDQPSSLIDGKKTLFRFFIGPNNPKNAIGKAIVTIARPLSEATEDVPLSITMECNFCTGRRTDLIKVVYHGQTQLSSEAQFHIVPNLAMAQSLGSALIVVDIRNSDTAVRYNQLAIKMSVQGAKAAQTTDEPTGLEEGSFYPQVIDTRSFKPDVIVTLRPEYGKPFDVGFEAINPELRKQLSGLELGRKQIEGIRQVQFFHTYDLTSNELHSKQSDALAALRGLMDQQNIDLQKALTSSVNGAVVLDTKDFVKLSPPDQSKAFSTFVQLGDYLYTRLFLNSGATLKSLIGKLEAFSPTDKHTVRILIKTSGQAFPWQLLHVPDADQNSDFWGLKYEVAVEDMSRPSPAAVLKKLSSDNNGASLFGTYVGADYSVQSLGGQQVKYFSQAFPAKSLIPANSSVMFTDSLRKKSRDLDMILVYTHGSDGWVSQLVNGQYVRFQLDPPGQRLIFSQDGSSVKPTDITSLANGFDTSKGPFLRRNPVVLLNACETGMLITDEFTLPQAFLHLGARAVIATEAPVSNQFALLFGNALIDQMAQGKDMAAGVLNVRLKFLAQGNPLGLVYAYYMNDGIAEVTEAK